MTRPATQAGQHLYGSIRGRQAQTAEPLTTLPSEGLPYLDAILAIEAEARAEALREAAYADALGDCEPSDDWCVATCPLDSSPHLHLTAKGSQT